MNKTKFIDYIKKDSIQGSNKLGAYIQAIKLLEPILKNSKTQFSKFSDIWNITSVADTINLYNFVIEQQKLFKKDKGIFMGYKSPSYWKNGFCSAALNAYKEFLIIMSHEQKMWNVYNNPNLNSAEVAKQLLNNKIINIENLIDNAGKEILRTVKTRVNQQLFRKMILKSYNNSCCITGLNIPEVLRASHISAWAEDKQNRLNPTNGLCLSATYDAAFDRHLISFDEKYRMILSPSLKEHYTNQAFKTYFKDFEGNKLTLPNRFKPDNLLLEKHRNKIIEA